ncbi:LytR/AlgR family response regulator transcription factor [Rhodanobacter umsongensis]|uniref:LytR/AlgR family response regulator transcription factor n=1 Tax=Rhodanobacter umsongensis TaxID=633153 RepID=A0ABW0JKW9_9GAMM
MTVRVLVVDDEPLARRGVIKRLAAHNDMQVVGEAGDGKAALSAILDTTPDLVFMDVQMPGMGGLEALGTLSPRERPMTIFLTAYDQFALRAFEVQALDYLLKPIDDERFAEALDRSRETLATRRGRSTASGLQMLLAAQRGTPDYASRFAVRIGNRVAFIDAADIDWIEAMGDYAGLHVGSKVYLLRERLHQLSRRLDPTQFMRIHRSTIVRVNRIAEMEALSNRDSLLRLHDGTPLRASRTYGEALRAALAG